MSDVKPEAEMPTGGMDEAQPEPSTHTSDNKHPENAAEIFRATANVPIPELLGVIPQEGLLAPQAHLPKPVLRKMPGEPDAQPVANSGKMPGE